MAGLLAVAPCAVLACGGSDEPSPTTKPPPERNPFEGVYPPPGETPDTSQVEVPDVIDFDGEEAVGMIEDAGLEAVYDESDPAGCEVKAQDPEAGELVDEGTSVELVELDCRQRDWDNEEGKVWDEFETAYVSGWGEGCAEAFSPASDGYTLYDENGDEVTVSDCESNNPGSAIDAETPLEVPDDPAAFGEELGRANGCESAYDDLTFDGYLREEGERYDSSVCPAAP